MPPTHPPAARDISPRDPLSRRAAIWSVVGLAMLLVIVAVGGFTLRQVEESDFWVDHTYNVITNLGQIDADIKDAQAAERGYIITGDAEYLEPYNASATNISPTLSKLMQLTADNPTQQARVRKLGLLIEQRMVVLNDALTARRESGFDAARDVVVTGHGRIVMSEIRAADQEIVDEEYKLLRERTQIRQARLKAGFTAEIVAGALALIALIVAPIDVRRAVRLRQAAEQEKEESAATAHALFQTAAQAIVVVNSGGQIVMANPATEKMLGYEESELTGKAIETLVPEAYRAQHVGQRDSYFHHPENRPMGLGRDLQARRKDGTTFDAEISLSYIQSTHGTLGVAFVSDISQRKADESEIRQQREDLRRLAGRLMTAQDDERRRIARDLHDDLSQKLAYLSMDMGKLINKPSPDWQGHLRAFQRRAADAAESVRHISHQLHPSVLEDIGLAAAVEQYCEEFEERSGIHTHFSAHEIPDSIPRDVANSVYHIFRESLRNVSKHSQTQDVFVTLEAAGGMLQLSVRDEGVGLPIERTKSGASIGIIGMQERAHLVNGTVEIDSKVGEGTDVTVTVPLGDGELNERREDFGNDV